MTGPTLELSPTDFTSTYPLPAGVESTIPTTAQSDEPGAHWVARGLLVETCARLLARPLSVGYLERRRLTAISATVSLASTVLSSDPSDVVVTVDLLLDRESGRWALSYRDRMIATGSALPPPSWLGELVAIDHDRGRRPLPVRRGPVAKPKHLW